MSKADQEEGNIATTLSETCRARPELLVERATADVEGPPARCPVDHADAARISPQEKAQAERQKLLKTGWPRPYVDIDEKTQEKRRLPAKLPVVWSEAIGNVDRGEFALGADLQAGIDLLGSGFSLCDVCGEALGDDVIYPSNHDGSKGLGPSGLHPKCCLLTLKFCPHFRDREAGWNQGDIMLMYSKTGPAVDLDRVKKMLAPHTVDSAIKALSAKKWSANTERLSENIFSDIFANPPLDRPRLSQISVADLRKLPRPRD